MLMARAATNGDAIGRLQAELSGTKRQLAEAVAARIMQQEEMGVLTSKVASLSASVGELRQAASRQGERESAGDVIGPMRLDPDVAREVNAVRRDWTAASADARKPGPAGPRITCGDVDP